MGHDQWLLCNEIKETLPIFVQLMMLLNVKISKCLILHGVNSNGPTGSTA